MLRIEITQFLEMSYYKIGVLTAPGDAADTCICRDLIAPPHIVQGICWHFVGEFVILDERYSTYLDRSIVSLVANRF